MGVVRKETKMVHKVRRQDSRSVILMETRGQRQRDGIDAGPDLDRSEGDRDGAGEQRRERGCGGAPGPPRAAPEPHHPAHVDFPPRAVCARETCLRGVTPAES